MALMSRLQSEYWLLKTDTNVESPVKCNNDIQQVVKLSSYYLHSISVAWKTTEKTTQPSTFANGNGMTNLQHSKKSLHENTVVHYTQICTHTTWCIGHRLIIINVYCTKLPVNLATARLHKYDTTYMDNNT